MNVIGVISLSTKRRFRNIQFFPLQPISEPTLLFVNPMHAIADNDVGPMVALEKNSGVDNR